ncbi:DUF3810 domain-containing protein [Adhaeribacter pallidiroseus]|uniref:DUF3810 domain-containing protein n=1 Tax=Adhaeribacter pallidiroseus TaxID=2072847 RepID=A0A369QEX1_9BACT|nr:DUF3810 domain-containing protein [Adhaeribacter pallidiroseus]RDC61746.1 hypothetical protein AHMF7616_00328 [Adhaeribacter pallidiroseus]
MRQKYFNIFIYLSLPLQILIVQLISLHPLLVENFYTGNLYKKLSQFLRFVFGSVPVPIGQILFYSLVTGLLVAIIKHVKKRVQQQISWREFYRSSLLGVVTFLSLFYFLFTGMWALNYHRRPIEEIAHLPKDSVSTKELETLCRRLIQLTNDSRQQITFNQQRPVRFSLTKQQLLARAPRGFAVVAKNFPEMTYTYPAVKSVYVPQVMSFFGVSGIYFPFTGEANVNMHPPDYLLPGTICHEMAHQIGFASEDEANYVAYLTCRLNPEPAFQYSGNYMAMKYAMNRLKKVKPRVYKNLERLYSAGVKQDLAENRRYWEKFQNPVEVFSGYFYDLFLKANDQRDGIKSYSKVVELLMGEFRKNQLNYPAQTTSGASEI